MNKKTILLILVFLALACGPLSLEGEEQEPPPTLSEVEEEATVKASKSDQPSPTPEAKSTQPEPSPTPLTEPTLAPSATPIPDETEESILPLAESEAGRLIDNFEGDEFDDRWWSYAGEGIISFACALDQPGYASEQALQLTFEIDTHGYASCGLDVDPDPWQNAEGLSFFWRADQPGLTVIVVLEMEDPTQTNPEAEGITPFQVELQTPGQEWTPVKLTWRDFAKAEWVGEGGVGALDLTRVVALHFDVGEAQKGSVWVDDLQLQAALGGAAATVPSDTSVPSEPGPVVFDKWALWIDGPHLRGANIWQAIVIPELDGTEFKGDGRVGPPYIQEDFDQLAAMGANYVSISGPGLFTETPPYQLDPGVQENLDNLLEMIANADMFATIGFRTGPGRSEFGLCCGGDAYFDGYFNDTVWEDQAAQDAWVEMWRYTADRYGDNPIVAGYKLMVEPNSSGVFFDIYDPDEFYADYAGTLYDWNQFYPRLVAGIREVDADTPILVGGNGWSGVAWLPYVQPTDDSRTVYIVHQYEPQGDYTHQEPGGENTYPGVWDTDYDGEDDQFDRAWLENLLSTVDEFAATHNVPVAVDEYGVNRWVPGGAEFMDDQMDLFEQLGMNQALWEWQTSWKPFAEDTHDMTYRFGPDPNNLTEVPNELMDVITKYWARNTVRPSTFAVEGNLTPLPPTSAPLGQNVPTPPAGHIYHGVYPGEAVADSKPPPEDGIPFEEDGLTPDDLRSYEQHVGKTAAWVYFSHNWFRKRSFLLSTASWIRDAGSIPYIRLMLRSSSEQNVAEPTFTLDRIINGDFDDDLHAWAREARDFGSPLIVEYGTEVNGEWFSWNGSWNGAGTLDGYGDPAEYDGPERFRDAYRHIIQITRDEGASNITWVFHADAHDIPDEAWNRLELYYPGDEWIDWLGVSVYGALDPTDDEWLQFRDGMDAVYPRLAALSPDKPIALLEFGVTSGNPLGDQAEWAEAALTDLIALRWPRLIGFSWWNEFWQNDDDPNHNSILRVQNNPDLAAVFQELVGNEPKVLGRVSQSAIQVQTAEEPASIFAHETRPDGAIRLTDPSPNASDQNPAFSPDGTHLLFTRFENGYNEGPAALYLLDLATGDVNLLTAAPDSDNVNLPGTSWNAATDRITFASDREDTDEVWTMTAGGSDLFRVTRHSTAGYFIEPSFSPDGQWLVFEVDPDAPDEKQQGSIWKVRADGSSLTKITDGPANGLDDRQPNWSPTGNRIIFQRRLPGNEDWNLYTLAVDGSDVRPVTTAPSSDTDASWSPDGRWIVYSSDYGELPVPNIFVIPAQGGEPIRVTHDETRYDGAPAWSPDGQGIAFESYPGDEDTPAALWYITAPTLPEE